MKKLTFISLTEDGTYVLRDSLCNICTSKDGEIVGVHKSSLAEEHPFLDDEEQAREILLQTNDQFIIMDWHIEEIPGFGEQVLNEEDLINFFIGEKQDFSSEYWKNPMHKELYLQCIKRGYDIETAKAYVSMCDVFGYDIGSENYHIISCALGKQGFDTLEAIKKESPQWQFICQNMYKNTSNGRFTTMEGIKDFWRKTTFVYYNDKNFYEWFKKQKVFKKIME